MPPATALRTVAAFALLLLCPALVFFPPAAARAHGGLPVAQQLLWRGNDLLVPTPYWGIFVGRDGGPWHWICDEAINSYQQHTYAAGQDGTLYVTDRSGMQVSRDGGCSWDAVTGPLSTQYIVSLVADPQSPRIWALASGDMGGTYLWSSDDTGRTWTSRRELPMTWPAGLYVSADGKSVIVGLMTDASPRQAQLVTSTDGGATFVTQTVQYLVAGQPLTQIAPIFVDPQSPGDLYVAARADTVSVLLRLRAAAAPTEYLRLAVSIFDMARDPQSGALIVATAAGLYAQNSGGTFDAQSALSSSRCLSSHGGSLYACGWNFMPDFAAVARLSAGATQKSTVFQYQQAQGPISCPADTPVGKICPMAWNIYADQLGITPQKDPTPTPSGGCQFATATNGAGSALGGLLLFAGLLMARRRRSHAA